MLNKDIARHQNERRKIESARVEEHFKLLDTHLLPSKLTLYRGPIFVLVKNGGCSQLRCTPCQSKLLSTVEQIEKHRALERHSWMETARENMKQAEKWRTKFIEVKKQLDNVLAGNSSLTIKKTSVPVIKEDGTFSNYGQSLEQDVAQDVVQDVQEFVSSVQIV